MIKLSFVRTMIPAGEFKDKETLGNIVYKRFDAVKDESTDSYICVECAYDTENTVEEEVAKAYKNWEQAQEALTLSQAKEAKTQEIERYDTSDKVNGFKLNGTVFWLDKATRVGLMNSTTIAKNMGSATTDLWLGEVKLTIPCDTVIKLLSAIEMYALECFNTTARHKAEVQELKTVEDVEKYDIKEGYPKQLEINLDGQDR